MTIKSHKCNLFEVIVQIMLILMQLLYNIFFFHYFENEKRKPTITQNVLSHYITNIAGVL
jgi:hypothetical protein